MGSMQLAFVAILALLCQASTAAKPHILLILVDDWGWGNVGFHAGGSDENAATKEEVVTPNIDKLASEGIILDRCYTYNYCSPTRSALQTGRLPVHVVVTNDEPIVQNKDDPISGYSGAPIKYTGLAQKMKEGGYRTYMTGKWDAGFAHVDQTPMGKGYETYFGYFHHANDYWDETLGASSTATVDICYEQGHKIVDLWNSTLGHGATKRNNTVYEEELFTENTLKVIANHDPSEPLFLFHSFHLCHAPLQVPKDYEDKFSFVKPRPRRKYAAMIHYMDDQVGKFIDAFKEKGMYDNTLVVMSSDNGGPIYAMPTQWGEITFGAANNIGKVKLRGGKLSDFEGGIRVNALVSGGYLPEERRGIVFDKYIHLTDMYATLAALAGVDSFDTQSEPYGLPKVDAINMLDALMGKTDESLRNEIHVSTSTVISGDWKLMTGWDVSVYLPGVFKNLSIPYMVPFNGYWPGWAQDAPLKTMASMKLCYPACLYNIRQDPSEHHDLFHKNATTKAKGHALLDRLKELNKSFFAPNRGEQNPEACTVFMDKYDGFYGPFVGINESSQPPAEEKIEEITTEKLFTLD